MIIVGDIHGDIVRMQQIVHFAGTQKTVFVGDFLDSFQYDISDQIQCIDFALDLVESGRSEVILGNHELSYISPYCICSGYNAITKTLLEENQRLSKISSLFKKYVFLKDANILITHAGLNAGFAQDYELDVDNVAERIDSLASLGYRQSPLYHAGRARGGSARVGGIFWSDWRTEFIPVKGLRQVFGHTNVQNISNREENYNVDCLMHKDEVLYYDESVDTFEILNYVRPNSNSRFARR